MSKCKNCGMDIGDSRFCPACGTSVSGDTPIQYPGADTRQRSLAEMEQMRTYFGAKREQFAELDKVSAEVDDRSARTYLHWIIIAAIGVLIGIWASAWFFFVIAALSVAVFVIKKRNNKQKLEAVTARQKAILQELTDYYEAYGYCSVGIEYIRPQTLDALYDLIRKGRASTPGDAINIYLADLEQAEMHRLQAEATEAAKQTAKAAKQTAKNSKKAAGYASASFWFK